MSKNEPEEPGPLAAALAWTLRSALVVAGMAAATWMLYHRYYVEGIATILITVYIDAEICE